jgi:hypothetical protein
MTPTAVLDAMAREVGPDSDAIDGCPAHVLSVR